MSHLTSASVTQWTVRAIVSTQTVQCWVGMKRESFVRAGTPHCRSSQMRTSTTCFSGLSQTVTTSESVTQTISMYGLVLTPSMSTTLTNGIGLTANLPVRNHRNLLVYNFHSLASPAMGHWGTCPLDFQVFNFSGHLTAAKTLIFDPTWLPIQ